jgi:hypothetical protein
LCIDPLANEKRGVLGYDGWHETGPANRRVLGPDRCGIGSDPDLDAELDLIAQSRKADFTEPQEWLSCSVGLLPAQPPREEIPAANSVNPEMLARPKYPLTREWERTPI